MVWSSVTAHKISRALFPTKAHVLLWSYTVVSLGQVFLSIKKAQLLVSMQYFRLFGQYHLCNSRIVVISANLSLSRAICEWNEYKLCAD